MILIDTSVWVDLFNQTSTPESDRLQAYLLEREPIALCGVVLTEILMGFREGQIFKRVQELLESIPLTQDLDRKGYEAAADLYRLCRAKGYTVRSTVDCLIAQTCIRNDLFLLARDRDFEQIARCSALKLV